mmetsp:Transcript_47159/g.150545  ORF Transcript_47159/g.150545 Transcript_47159/m.150545 type:complete len:258 (+) Transcript_47159:479-1252(+)
MPLLILVLQGQVVVCILDVAHVGPRPLLCDHCLGVLRSAVAVQLADDTVHISNGFGHVVVPELGGANVVAGLGSRELDCGLPQFALLLYNDVLYPLREDVNCRCQDARGSGQLLHLQHGVLTQRANLHATRSPLRCGVDVVAQLREVPHDIHLGICVLEPRLKRRSQLLQFQVEHANHAGRLLSRIAAVPARQGTVRRIPGATGGFGGLDEVETVVAHDLEVLNVRGGAWREGWPCRLPRGGHRRGDGGTGHARPRT